MNGLPYYKAYPRDFIEGTIGIPFEVKAAYRLLLDLIYMQNGRLADDARYISGHLGLTVRKWNLIRSELVDLGKIQIISGFISNYRVDKELEISRKFQVNQSEKASKSNKNKGLERAAAKPARDNTEPDTDINTVANATVSPEPEKSGPVCIAMPVTTGSDIPIFESEVDDWSKAFPAVDVRQQLAAMRAWVIANPTKRKTPKGVRRFIVAWLDREQNRGGQRPQPRQGQPPAKKMTDLERIFYATLEPSDDRPNDFERNFPDVPRLPGS